MTTGRHASRCLSRSSQSTAKRIVYVAGQRSKNQKGEDQNEENQNVNGIHKAVPFFLLG